jgi:hypothetical protein
MEITVSASSVRNIVLRSMQSRRPVFIWGPPGIGKSELVADIAHSGALGNACTIDMRLALCEPTDLRGYPYRDPETNTMRWSPPIDLPSAELAAQYDHIVLFLDELNSAPQSVQAAAYQLVLNRRVGQYVLPDNVVIVAAGNRETDRGVTYRMPAPLANRFRHVVMDVNYDDWKVWAVQHNVHPDVVGYLSWAKQDLFDFNPKTSSQAFATPRSWVSLSDTLYNPDFDQADSREQRAELAGIVGDGLAVKFQEHRRVGAHLPRPSQVITGEVLKLKSDVAKEISAKYSLTTGLAYELKAIYTDEQRKATEFRAAINHVVRFAFGNFEPEMVVFLFKTLMQDYQIRFNMRTELDADLLSTFNERYIRYIV